MLSIDLHIHSIHSGHAYGTIYEIADEARRKNMQMIAITDHGPAMAGGPGVVHFIMGDRAPKSIDGLRVLWGCEANIVDGDGRLDLPPQQQQTVDVILTNIHAYSGYQDLGVEGNTAAVCRALANPRVRVLSHPVYPHYRYREEQVFEEASRQGVLLELNLSYLRGELDAVDRYRRLVEFARANGQKLLVNSDAHFVHEIGDDSILRETWERLGMSEELIINNYPEELMAALRIAA